MCISVSFSYGARMNLREWVLVQGLHPQTAYKWLREGKLPVPATRVGPRTILVNMDSATAPAAAGGVGLYARVSSHEAKPDLERHVARLSTWAAQAGLRVVGVECEVGSGMNGARVKARRLLADPAVSMVVVEHRDRLGRMKTELLEAAVTAWGRRLVVLETGEVDNDLVGDMVEVLRWFCAGLYGRRSAKNRAERALACAGQDPT